MADSLWSDLDEALLSGSHVVCGRSLKPYCAYYHYWLKAIDSPLMKGGQITPLDLEIATRICSCEYGTAPLQIKPRWTDKWRILYNTFRYPVADSCEQFAAYIEDYNSPPRKMSNGNTISTSNAEPIPFVIWLVTGLMTVLHFPLEKAWMLPIGEAEWYLAASDVFRDKECSIIPGQDREFMEGLTALKAQKAKEHGEHIQ